MFQYDIFEEIHKYYFVEFIQKLQSIPGCDSYSLIDQLFPTGTSQNILTNIIISNQNILPNSIISKLSRLKEFNFSLFYGICKKSFRHQATVELTGCFFLPFLPIWCN